MSESLESKLRAVAAEIASLEVEAKKLRLFQSQAFLRHQSFPIEKQLELEEFHRKIAEAQQKQMSYLLASLGESSNRLEIATKNLKESSEAQVPCYNKVAEVLKASRETHDLAHCHRHCQYVPNRIHSGTLSPQLRSCGCPHRSALPRSAVII